MSRLEQLVSIYNKISRGNYIELGKGYYKIRNKENNNIIEARSFGVLITKNILVNHLKNEIINYIADKEEGEF